MSSLREALIEARLLGCTVAKKPSTGETVVRFPGLRPVRLNNRRKDAPTVLVTFLRRVRTRSKVKAEYLSCDSLEDWRGHP